MGKKLPASGTEHIAQSLKTYVDNDTQARFLSFRICGFSIRESAKLAGIHEKTVFLWRKNPEFTELEKQVATELGEQLKKDAVRWEFIRNLRLVLDHDFKVLDKLAKGEELTIKEHQYLLKLRTFYTPEHLRILVGLMEDKSEPKDFAGFILKLKKTQEMTLTGKNEAVPALPQPNDKAEEQ